MFQKLVAVAALSIPFCSFAADENTVFEVPKLANINIDGKADDWGDNGLKISDLTDTAGKKQSPSNFTPTFRLGWDERGLLVLVNVIDDVASEPAEKPEELWKGDSIELFMANDRGGDSVIQVVIAPGRDPKHNTLRTNLSDYRKEKKGKLEVKAGGTTSDNGYQLEVLLPWTNLKIEAKEGANVGLQFYANDVDHGDARYQALWFPKPETHQDSKNMYRLKLVDKPAATQATPPVASKADAPKITTEVKPTKVTAVMIEDNEVTVTAPASMKGKEVKIKDGDKTVGKAKLEADGDNSSAKVKLSKPKDKGKGYGNLTVSLDDETLMSVEVKK